MKYYLTYYPINSQGYDRKGCYYGSGPLLYQYRGLDYPYSEDIIRAQDREDAKCIILRNDPTATFFR